MDFQYKDRVQVNDPFLYDHEQNGTIVNYSDSKIHSEPVFCVKLDNGYVQWYIKSLLIKLDVKD